MEETTASTKSYIVVVENEENNSALDAEPGNTTKEKGQANLSTEESQKDISAKYTINQKDFMKHAHKLPNDIFSLAEMMDEKYYDRMEGKVISVLGITVFIVECLALILFTNEIFNDSLPVNDPTMSWWEQIPAAVSVDFRVAQIVAAVYTTFLTAEEIYNSIIECGSDDSWGDRFWNFCRFTNGMLTILACGVTIITQDEIVEMIKDFTAVTFLCQLDSVVYECINFGWFGLGVQHVAIVTKLEKPHRKRWAGENPYIRVGTSLLTLSPFIVWYFIVMTSQESGTWLCGTIEVTVDLKVQTSMSLGGIYKYTKARDPGTSYPIYVQQSTVLFDNSDSSTYQNTKYKLLWNNNRWGFYSDSYVDNCFIKSGHDVSLCDVHKPIAWSAKTKRFDQFFHG